MIIVLVIKHFDFKNIDTRIASHKSKNDIIYHRENRERAEMIREQNSINPNGAAFLMYNRLLGY